MTIPDWIEIGRPWLTTITSTGALGGVVTILLKWKRLKLTEKQEDRQGFGVLIEALQKDVTRMRTEHQKEIASIRSMHASEIKRLEEEHRGCQDRLSKIEGELMGFHRQALIASNQGVAVLPASSMVKDAGNRAVDAAHAAIKSSVPE